LCEQVYNILILITCVLKQVIHPGSSAGDRAVKRLICEMHEFTQDVGSGAG
jgi:hypothetical protein